VLSGYVRDIVVSSLAAGATAPESGDFEYSVRPFALHADRPATTAIISIQPRPRIANRMGILL